MAQRSYSSASSRCERVFPDLAEDWIWANAAADARSLEDDQTLWALGTVCVFPASGGRGGDGRWVVSATGGFPPSLERATGMVLVVCQGTRKVAAASAPAHKIHFRWFVAIACTLAVFPMPSWVIPTVGLLRRFDEATSIVTREHEIHGRGPGSCSDRLNSGGRSPKPMVRLPMSFRHCDLPVRRVRWWQKQWCRFPLRASRPSSGCAADGYCFSRWRLPLCPWASSRNMLVR